MGLPTALPGTSPVVAAQSGTSIAPPEAPWNGTWIAQDRFSAPATGTYALSFRADDGAIVLIDGEVVGATSRGGGINQASVTILGLTMGQHVLEAIVSNNGNGQPAFVPYGPTGASNPTSFFCRLSAPDGMVVAQTSDAANWRVWPWTRTQQVIASQPFPVGLPRTWVYTAPAAATRSTRFRSALLIGAGTVGAVGLVIGLELLLRRR